MRKYMDIINESEAVEEGMKDYALAGAGALALGAAGAAYNSGDEPVDPSTVMGMAHDDHEHFDTAPHGDEEHEGAIKGGKKGDFSFIYYRADEEASDEITLDGQSLSIWSRGGETMNKMKASVAVKNGYVFVGWKGKLEQGLHGVQLPDNRTLLIRVN